MDFEDFAQPEVGVAVAITAVAASPTVRKTLRKGAAYGLAGALLAGDAAHRFVNAIAKGAKSVTHHDKEAIPAVVDVVVIGAENA